MNRGEGLLYLAGAGLVVVVVLDVDAVDGVVVPVMAPPAAGVVDAAGSDVVVVVVVEDVAELGSFAGLLLSPQPTTMAANTARIATFFMSCSSSKTLQNFERAPFCRRASWPSIVLRRPLPTWPAASAPSAAPNAPGSPDFQLDFLFSGLPDARGVSQKTAPNAENSGRGDLTLPIRAGSVYSVVFVVLGRGRRSSAVACGFG
jgi:hypothetical protein